MTREINSIFECEDKTYKIVKSAIINNCSECVFVEGEDRCCPSIYDKIGSCSSLLRTDNTDVHFELVNKD